MAKCFITINTDYKNYFVQNRVLCETGLASVRGRKITLKLFKFKMFGFVKS